MAYDPESAARFEKFTIMRLENKSDLVYRNYDLLTPDRSHGNIRMYLRAAGFDIRASDPYQILAMLRQRYIGAGYGERNLDWYETVLHEFWVYQRIKHYGKKNWPYRDPDTIKALHSRGSTGG